MKKLLLILLLFLSVTASAQTWTPQYDQGTGYVSGFTKNNILALPYMDYSVLDTSQWRYEYDYSSGLYKYIVNKDTINGILPGKLRLPIFYNPDVVVAGLDNDNTYTGVNVFLGRTYMDSLILRVFLLDTGTSITRNILPQTTRLYNFGSGSYYWLNQYTQNLYIDTVKTEVVFSRDVKIDSTVTARKVDADTINATGDIKINGNSVRPYKVYSALLTQSGDGTTNISSGLLEIGKRYKINDIYGTDDFSNVANVVFGTINTNDCEFIATGTTPAVWTNSSELNETSAPVATVLENTIGNIVWSRSSIGMYVGTLADVFIVGKVFAPNGIIGGAADNLQAYEFSITSNSTIRLISGMPATQESLDNLFLNTPIEIRVYY